jgi:hypothetical protein
MEWAGFVFGTISALAVLVPFVIYLARKLKRISMFSDPRLSHFLDDWFGEDARPGFTRKPGVPERLAEVESQLKANGGASLRDAVNRIEARVRIIEERGQ